MMILKIDWAGGLQLLGILILVYLVYDVRRRTLLGRKKVMSIDTTPKDDVYNKDELTRLNKSLALFKKLEEIRNVGVWSWDVFCDHIEISEGFNEIWDINEFERIPVKTFMDCIHNRDRSRVEGVLQEALKNGKGYEIQFTIVRRDKKEVDVKICAKAYHDEATVFNNLSGSIEKV